MSAPRISTNVLDKPTSTRLSSLEFQELVACAKNLKTTPSLLVRSAILKYIKYADKAKTLES